MKKIFTFIFITLITIPILAAQQQSVDDIKGFRDVKFGDNVRLNPDFTFYKFPFQEKAIDMGMMVNTKDNLFFEGYEFKSIQYYDKHKDESKPAVFSITLEYECNSINEIDAFYNYFVDYYSKQFGKGAESKTKTNRKLEEYETENSNTTFSTVWTGNKIILTVRRTNTIHRMEMKRLGPMETRLYYAEIWIALKSE